MFSTLWRHFTRFSGGEIFPVMVFKIFILFCAWSWAHADVKYGEGSWITDPECAEKSPAAACINVGNIKGCFNGWEKVGVCEGKGMRCCMYNPTGRCERKGGTCFAGPTCPKEYSLNRAYNTWCHGKTYGSFTCCTQNRTAVDYYCRSVSPWEPTRCFTLGEDRVCPGGWVAATPPRKCVGKNQKCCTYNPTRRCKAAGGICFLKNECPVPFITVKSFGKELCEGPDMKCCKRLNLVGKIRTNVGSPP